MYTLFRKINQTNKFLTQTLQQVNSKNDTDVIAMNVIYERINEGNK